MDSINNNFESVFTNRDKIKIYSVIPIFIQFIVISISKIFFKVFFNYKVSGVENLENLPRGVIFAANHVSELDPVLMTISLPYLSNIFPVFYVSREKRFYENSGWRKIFYGGVFFKMCGAYQVYSGLKDYEISLKNHIEILNDNYSICIFPEGRKSKSGLIGESRGGVGYLAYRTKKVVIPVTMKGLYNLKLSDFIKRKNLHVNFGKPLYTDDLFEQNDRESNDIANTCKNASNTILNNIKATFSSIN